MKKARSFLGACFFLLGLACFASLSWTQRVQLEQILRAEPFYRCPVTLYSDRAMIRNDAHGKGYFGATRGNRGQRSHKGIDLLSRVGSPILASKSGRVSYAGIDRGYGWYIEIQHPDGLATRYAHMTRLSVSGGDWVVAGQPIGLCGKSGNADDPRIQPHLHFEIRHGKTALDPVKKFYPALKIS